MKPNVLVTAIGTAAATTIVCELRKTNAYHIMGADINPASRVATSREVDEFFTFPPAVPDTESYISYVLNFCREKKVDFYFAIIDEEVAALSSHEKDFEAIGVRLCIANAFLVSTCHYKNEFSRWIGREMPGIGIKTFYSLDEIRDEDFPLFVKPMEGRASIGCQKILTREELMQYMEGLKTEDVVIQQCVSGEVVTVDLIRNDTTGQKMQMQRRELLRNGSGCGIAVEIIDEPVLHKICDELMEKLHLNGVVNAEFFCTEDGYRIIEINPRFSAGSSFSCAAGCNTPLNALLIAEKRECVFNEVPAGRHFAKRYETYCLD